MKERSTLRRDNFISAPLQQQELLTPATATPHPTNAQNRAFVGTPIRRLPVAPPAPASGGKEKLSLQLLMTRVNSGPARLKVVPCYVSLQG